MKSIDKDGYIYVPLFPARKTATKTREHVALMEKTLGRRLRRGEQVHHKDENKANNDPSNLLLISTGEHARIHRQQHFSKNKMYSDCFGISKHKTIRPPWFGQLRVNGIKYQTKYYKTEVEAAVAYDCLVIEHLPGGKINFPFITYTPEIEGLDLC